MIRNLKLNYEQKLSAIKEYIMIKREAIHVLFLDTFGSVFKNTLIKSTELIVIYRVFLQF